MVVSLAFAFTRPRGVTARPRETTSRVRSIGFIISGLNGVDVAVSTRPALVTSESLVVVILGTKSWYGSDGMCTSLRSTIAF